MRTITVAIPTCWLLGQPRGAVLGMMRLGERQEESYPTGLRRQRLEVLGALRVSAVEKAGNTAQNNRRDAKSAELASSAAG